MADEHVIHIEQPIHIETAPTLEDLTHKLASVMGELAGAGIAVQSISHAVDTSSVEARFSALIFGETRFP